MATAPAPPARGSVAGPLWSGAVVGAATAVLALRTPYAPGSYGICPSILLFGIQCPFCGGLRATHSLAHGDLAAAWAMNPLVVVAAPLAVVAWGWWLGASLGWWRPLRVRVPAWSAWVFLALMVGWTVARNVSGLGIAAPTP